jgi:hypothetical protein
MCLIDIEEKRGGNPMGGGMPGMMYFYFSYHKKHPN